MDLEQVGKFQAVLIMGYLVLLACILVAFAVLRWEAGERIEAICSIAYRDSEIIARVLTLFATNEEEDQENEDTLEEEIAERRIADQIEMELNMFPDECEVEKRIRIRTEG